MIGENRKIYNPKQDNRALKRAFFIYPHETGDHILFSKTMAKECLLLLFSDVPFKLIPSEWKTPSIKSSLDILSNKVGAWFESKVSEELNKLGIPTICSLKKIILNDRKRIFIPPDVGEIDIIAYSETDRTLLVIECKLAKSATEPKFYRNDMQSFVRSKKSYKRKFIKKYKWVEDNFSLISDFAVEKLPLETKPNRLGFAMVTFYPTVASKFIDDFSCISIAELISSYKKDLKWQFSYLDIKS